MFRRLVVMFLIGGKANYQDTSSFGSDSDESAFEIYFDSFRYMSDIDTVKLTKRLALEAGIDWFFERRGRWFFDPIKFHNALPDFALPPWLTREAKCEIEIRHRTENVFGREEHKAGVFVRICEEDVTRASKVFLSHKTADKGMVRDIAIALSLAGVDPWLDESEMAAGANLPRSLSSAFKECRAAVFFLTENYKDAGYLASEIDYAVREKLKRPDFMLIPVRIVGAAGETLPTVPELLESFVWKDVPNGLRATIEILKALQSQLN